MFFWKNRNKKHFTVRFPEEGREVCTNPGRGWYHIYTFTLDKREKDGLLYQPYWDDETLVLVRFDIGAFRGMSLSEEALEYADEILKCFHSRGKEIILRVLYDTQGKGMEREPTLFSIVLTHMRQLGAVVRAYESDILITQGLFIGNWGEMHGSKFLDQEYIRKLYAAWRKAIGPDIRIALRKPSFCRMAVTNENDKAVPGVFDDAIFGSENHMGTFGVKRRADSAWTEDWCIADEIGYMQETCGQIPFGGEVLSGQNPAAKEMLRALCGLRVSYLNSIHEEQVLNRWKQMEYGEWGSFYQYIGAHLGYRFVAGSAVFYTDRIEVEIANTGFSNICDKTELALVRENEDGTEEVYQADYDLRMLAGQETVKIVFLLSGLQDEKKDRYFLKLTRCRGNVAIRFANEGGEERLYLR